MAMAKKAEAPAAPVVPPTPKKKADIFRDFVSALSDRKPYKLAKEELAKEMAKYGHELLESDQSPYGVVLNAKFGGVREAGGRVGTGAVKRTAKSLDFAGFCERIAETKMALDSLLEAVELVGDCESVTQAKDYLSKWDKLLTLCGGDISKAQEIVAIGL